MVSLRLERPADADVVVVGGGPAGAAVACHLASGGVDVMVLDRQRFPRDKVCGDFVGPAALQEAEDLGLNEVPGYAATNRIRRASVFVVGEHLVTAPMPEPGGLPAEGRVIPRLDFDAWLMGAAVSAGARLHA
jgi:menaquinone-9 beta-reductase